MPTFATPEPITATFDLPVAADVRVTAGERDDTVVTVTPRTPDKAADVRQAEQTTVEHVGDRVLVRAARHWSQWSPFGGHGAIDVVVELPAGSRVEGDLAMGRITGEGDLGACQLKTAMGDIHLATTGALGVKTSHGDITVDRVRGDVDAATSSGHIRIAAVEGGAVIRSSHGDTAIGEITGAVRLKTARGDVRVDRAHAPVSARSAHGDISVGRAGASVSAKTSHGDVRVGSVRQGSTVMETSAGEIEVGIPEGVAAWLDVRSSHGVVRNSLDEADGPASSEGTVEVRARTAVGDIVILRAPAEPAPPAP